LSASFFTTGHILNYCPDFGVHYNDSYGDWKITPKQFGSDLKKVAPILRDFGINCESLGKRGSFVKWKITTAEKIDLQANFFEKPTSAPRVIKLIKRPFRKN
jgi:hypothetical protein